jgi:hypothetical protein
VIGALISFLDGLLTRAASGVIDVFSRSGNEVLMASDGGIS